MATNKYFEKLKDPKWQKKRLEVLSTLGWNCQCCGDGESTLHVHHKQYFKGREPWEYDIDQLTVLCEDCHQNIHEGEDPLLLAASYVAMDGPTGRQEVASLVYGFCNQDINHACCHADPHSYMIGQIAGMLNGYSCGLSLTEEARILEICGGDSFEFLECLRRFIKEHEEKKAVE